MLINKEQVDHKYDKDSLAQLQAAVYLADSKAGQKPLAVSQVNRVNSGER